MFKIFLNLLNNMKNTSLFFTKFSSFATIATIFSLWLIGYLSDANEDILGFALILSVGILHGANDLKLLKQTLSTDRFSFLHLLIRYVIIVLLVGLSFFLVPSMALLIFIVLSAYHFGEQHWHHKVLHVSKVSYLYFTLYGFMIFGLLFYLNPISTTEVIYSITDVTIPSQFFKIFFLVSLLLFSILTSLNYSKKYMKINLFEELFLLLVFYIIFKTASLVLAFAVYFIFWHSLPSLIDQIKLLHGSVTKNSIMRYLKASLLYWLLAIIGLVFSIYFFNANDDYFLPIFFSFLAAITLPHVLVMHKTFQQ